MIAIVDYGMGNIFSVQNMFKHIDVREIKLTKEKSEIEQADKIILPGVGAFDNGMMNLNASGLIEVLNQKVLIEKKPVLGICLGMQLLTKSSEEGNLPGLSWINAKTKKFNFENSELKIPHMGWNYVNVCRDSLLTKMGEKNKYYFVHSYYVECENENDVLATCDYGFDFCCMIEHENIFGAQFHPEKSHKFGMELLKRFAAL